MYKVLIVGAGQLGSRHLQGVKKAKEELDIWVCDINPESLRVAEERYEQIEAITPKVAHFVDNIEAAPKDIDVAIIPSTSISRCAIVETLLKNHTVKYMILEKFLFPRLADYEKVSALLNASKTKTYVNCPMRLYESYKKIAPMIDSNSPIQYIMEGRDWGLCCNAIHHIDMFMYLTNEHTYSVNLEKVNPEVIPSKRNGYIELRGAMRFATPKGSTLTLISDLEHEDGYLVRIQNGETLFVVNEATGDVMINGELIHTHTPYQSELSGAVVDTLINTGTCGLTTYEESKEYHKTFLSAVLPYVNKLQGCDSDCCPIT